MLEQEMKYYAGIILSQLPENFIDTKDIEVSFDQSRTDNSEYIFIKLHIKQDQLLANREAVLAAVEKYEREKEYIAGRAD